MRIRYCKLDKGNFGDDLNVVLWPELFPDLETQHPSLHLYGVGTILGGERPSGPKVVLGSGCGYRGAPALDDSWRVYWVRGPRTAQRCGLDPSTGLGDGAVLWSGLRRPPAPVAGRVGLIPHHKSYDTFDWDTIAARAGLYAIDPRATPESVADAIGSCERVLTESLHGAIFADAMGLPWRATVLARRFNDFKWSDWLDTLGLTLHTADVGVELQRELAWSKALGNRLARVSGYGGAEARNHLRPVRAANDDDVAGVIAALRTLAADAAAFQCSDAARRARQLDAMRERCLRFADDYGLRFAG